MSTSGLLLLDLVLAAGTTAAWALATMLLVRPSTSAGSSRVLMAILAAVLLLVGQLVTGGLLSSRAWPLAQEKILFALPIQLVTAALAIVLVAPVLLARTATGRRPPSESRGPLVASSFIVAAAAGAAGILARAVVGFPVTAPAAVVLTLLVLLAGWLAFSLLGNRHRREKAGAASLLALVVVFSIGYSWLTDVAAPGAIAIHTHEGVESSSASAVGSTEAVSVKDLRTPADATGTVRRFDLTARHQAIPTASGGTIDAWTFGSLPGPEIRVTVGEVVDVTLHNKDIAQGVTIHWHGYDVPNGEDGVAGATQDPVLPGESFEYRFVANEVGTYWYHTHQASAEGISRGLFGVLIVLPADGTQEDVDLAVPLHTFGSTVWLGDADTRRVEAVDAGRSVRLRLTNTDQLPRRLRLTGTEFLVVAVDGRDLTGPTPLRGGAIRIPAGGRVDLTFVVPPTGALLSTDSTTRTALGVGPGQSHPLDLTVDRTNADLDLLAYGTRDVDVPSRMRDETMVLDQLPRFFEGVPTNAYTVNGAVFPHIDSIEVSEGDVVRLTVVNRGRETHPMHIHGHHVLVLSRDGLPATGSALWLDTFDVQPGEVWQVMLIADNPGIWMDHCHNLEHASQGMIMALAYRGVITPYDHAHISG